MYPCFPQPPCIQPLHVQIVQGKNEAAMCVCVCTVLCLFPALLGAKMYLPRQSTEVPLSGNEAKQLEMAASKKQEQQNHTELLKTTPKHTPQRLP